MHLIARLKAGLVFDMAKLKELTVSLALLVSVILFFWEHNDNFLYCKAYDSSDSSLGGGTVSSIDNLTDVTVPASEIKSRITNAYLYHPALEYFPSDQRQQIRLMVDSFMRLPSLDMWKPVAEISVDKPYIFFHQRKAGGTTMRKDLQVAADHLNLTYFIPCFGSPKVHCDQYTIPAKDPKAIYALHLQWSEQKKLAYHHQTYHDRRKLEFSCLTNFREPVSRMISCIYFRFLKYHGHYIRKSCISEFTQKELLKLLHERVDKYSNSCLNEPYRLFSGILDEDMLNNLGMHVNVEDVSIEPSLTTFSAEIFNLTLHRIAKCAPMILEYPESVQLSAYTFPQLAAIGAFDLKEAKLHQNYDTKCAPPQDKHMQILEKLGAYERIIYDAVLEKARLVVEQLKRAGKLPKQRVAVGPPPSRRKKSKASVNLKY